MEKIVIGLFFIFLVLLPFGQLTKIPLGFLNLPEVHLYLTDVVLFLLVAVWGLWRFWGKRRKYQLPSLAKPIFVFSGLALFSLLVNFSALAGREILVAFLYWWRWLIYALFYFVVSDLIKAGRLKVLELLKFLVVIGGAVAIFGLIQYFLWPNLKALEFLGYDPHFYRLAGTFLDPGFTGIVLVLTLIIISSSNLGKNWKSWEFWGNWGIWGIVYLALALTYSRASWLAFFFAVLLLAFFKKSWRFLLTLVVLMTLTYLILPRPAGEGGKIERVYTIEARLVNYQQALKVVKDNPFFGVGFNTYRYVQKNYGFLGSDWETSHSGAGVDSSLLFVLVTTGIFGLLGYLWIWLKAIQEVKRVKREEKIMIFVSLGALFIHSFFLNSLFYPWLMSWMWLLFACLS